MGLVQLVAGIVFVVGVGVLLWHFSPIVAIVYALFVAVVVIIDLTQNGS